MFLLEYEQVRGNYEENENISFRSICLVNYMRCFNDLNGRWFSLGIRVTYGHFNSFCLSGRNCYFSCNRFTQEKHR